MEYTVQKLSEIANVSTRTLRYYDEIGILKPARINSSGYRIYGREQIDRLQQILFYRELGVSLDKIKVILESPSFNRVEALKEHRLKLLEKQQQIEKLIANVNKTISEEEGEVKMADKEKFKGFKQKITDDNEKTYGKEIREKYGDETVDKSNAKLQGMTEKQYKEVTDLAEEIHEKLAEAFKIGDPASELAQEVAELHKRWLCFYWPTYSKEAHAGVAQMYVDDERFTAYYDKEVPGAAKFLRDVIFIYTGMNR